MKLGPAHLQVAYGRRDEPILNERFRAWHALFQSCPLQWLDFDRADAGLCIWNMELAAMAQCRSMCALLRGRQFNNRANFQCAFDKARDSYRLTNRAQMNHPHSTGMRLQGGVLERRAQVPQFL